MRKNLKILIIVTIIICLAITIGIFIKIHMQKSNNNKKFQEMSFLHDNFVMVDEDGYVLSGSRKDSIDPSTEKRLEKHEFVKGFVNYIDTKGGFIEIHNSYMVDSLCMTIDEYDHFFTKISFPPDDISIINYYTSEEMKLEEVSFGNLLLFNAKIIYSTIEEPIITLEDNKIFVLKGKDLDKMVLDKYQGEKVLKNVKIVDTRDYNFEGKDYKYLYVQMKFNSPQNDELVYCFILQLSDETIIENNEDSKYADIILKDSFENISEAGYDISCRKVSKITYK